ncbi:MAG: carboxypeptidase-like regulatory domain-containing protein [Bacteroidota bacterium]|nr:carboxypeptidase-like regulatory domain-containing protein [Bacteroidota bacterium]
MSLSVKKLIFIFFEFIHKQNYKILTLFFGFVFNCFCQKEINGLILSKESSILYFKGEPIIGATISIQNSAVSTISDFDGRFKIKTINKNDILVISCERYNTQYFSTEYIVDTLIVLMEGKVFSKIENQLDVGQYGEIPNTPLGGAILYNLRSLDLKGFRNIELDFIGKYWRNISNQKNGYEVTFAKGIHSMKRYMPNQFLFAQTKINNVIDNYINYRVITTFSFLRIERLTFPLDFGVSYFSNGINNIHNYNALVGITIPIEISWIYLTSLYFKTELSEKYQNYELSTKRQFNIKGFTTIILGAKYFRNTYEQGIYSFVTFNIFDSNIQYCCRNDLPYSQHFNWAR